MMAPCIVCGSSNRALFDGTDVRFYLFPIEPLCNRCLEWAIDRGVDPSYRVARSGFNLRLGYFEWGYYS